MKRPSTRRQHQQPPPLETARFKLQKPISKKHHKQQRRRWWWSSAASAAVLLFKRPSTSSSSTPNPTAGAAAAPKSPYGSASSVPLYFADDDESCGNDATAACACWAPAMRSGHHLAAVELGAASASVPYVSLRNADLISRGPAGGGAAPAAMPIYLVT
ncbi:hypothetical protein PR202_ga04413 [Eleusine coracana subsp. coracana]|uniref:Uncharacterized protein n=1 Tax=Eleusine coracana subsp. coracana TaxID=191504 RepID=A0AAV5BRW7_ELECO|nr:hypothetical protein PR202_ga04413 [Eleusine coracana subsp. coracana]